MKEVNACATPTRLCWTGRPGQVKTTTVGGVDINSSNQGGTRDRIITNAMALFAQHGYDKTTIAEIEEAAGLSPGSGSLYRHFKSKDELLLAAVQRWRAELAQLSERLDFTGTKNVRDALQRAAMLLVSFVTAQGDTMSVFAVQGLMFPPNAKQEIAAAWIDGYALFAKAIRDIAPAEVLEEHNVDALAVQMLGSASHYFGQTLAFDESSLPMPLLDYMGQWISTWTAFFER